MIPVILLVEDDTSFATVFKHVFAKSYKVIWAKTAAEGFKIYNSFETPFDVVVIDRNLPDLSGEDLAESIKKRNSNQQLLFSTGDLTVSTMQKLLESGLSNGFIPKGVANEEMKKKVDACIRAYQTTVRLLTPRSDSDLTAMEQYLKTFGIISASKEMFEVGKIIEIHKPLDIDVLILGESGTGKELVAKAFARKSEKYFAINCGAFSESSTFVESELFGHMKGAFTDAKEDKPGIFELAADNGVVFLDEVHALSKSAQTKLLRALQEKSVRRMGDTRDREIKCNFRLICAVKPNIKQLVEDGVVMPDLFYRIDKARIHLPRLSERPEDIEPLVAHFTEKFNRKHKMRKFFESSTLSELSKYSWPGNVRELESMVERLMCGVQEEVIKARHVQNEIQSAMKTESKAKIEEPQGLELAKQNFEKLKIISALKKSKTSKEAAIVLGLPRTTLLSRMEKLGINPIGFLLT